ncbi:hypothetical protein BKA70DRAFT_1494269 [Coprinopsis sp. MPI-PUGE-AT-0042]|nr:hypothetical protein BKA70DRAFT_1494269 [Coprinopsis sp. MPI-PUGE-AT-0042]
MPLEIPERVHRFLEIPEIIEQLPRQDGQGSLCTGLRLLYSCNVKSIFSEDVWRIEQDKGGNHLLFPNRYFATKATPTLRRLRYYTRHVKSIRCSRTWYEEKDDSFEACRFHYSALQAIHHHPSFPQTLFPNLRDVTLYSAVRYPLDMMFTSALVLSPSVRNVTLVTDDVWLEEALNDTLAIEHVAHQGGTALVNHVADIGPQLTSLKVQLEEGAEHGLFAAGVSTLLDTFPKFPPFRLWISLPSLGELDTLQTLRLPSLESISTETNSLETCHQFFHILDATSLNGVTLGCLLEGDISVAAFFEALHTSKRYAQREHIRVHELYTGEGHRWRFTTLRPRFIIGDRTARSLCPFKNLKTLSICPCDPLGIEDSDLE